MRRVDENILYFKVGRESLRRKEFAVLGLAKKAFGRRPARALAAAVLGFGVVGMSGCVVRVGPPPPRYYYRTRLVYTPSGPVYVRERVYVDPYAPAPTYYPPTAEQPAPAPAPAVAESSAAAELHPLVAPIALYPDPLIAVLLPASTYPQQVQDANAWLASNPNPPQYAIDAQPWEPSVKALVHYPSVLAQLARDAQWTESLGSAYINQPGDVMAAIQQMRAQAVAQGNLVDTPQQVVVNDGGVIAIEPANPELIYIPTYDPVLVYAGYHPLFFAELGYPIGPWFVNGIYWGGGVIFVGDWHGGYYFRDGRWGRDYGWRADHDHYWARDSRWGPPPRVDRGHYAFAHEVRGRDSELHRSMTQHSAQRHAVQQGGRNYSAGRSSSGAREQGHAPSGREGEHH